jgi:hypothetical protein
VAACVQNVVSVVDLPSWRFQLALLMFLHTGIKDNLLSPKSRNCPCLDCAFAASFSNPQWYGALSTIATDSYSVYGINFSFTDFSKLETFI